MRYLPLDELPDELRRRWAAARVWAVHEAPYLASALLALNAVVVDVSQEPPGSVDLRAFPADRRWHVYVDPEVLEEVTVPELGFWLLHQVSHLLREHAPRYPGAPAGLLDAAGDDAPTSLRGRTPEQHRWNIAADAEIDDDLTTANLKLPPRAVHPRQLGLPESWTAEQYWDELAGKTVSDAGELADAGPASSRSSSVDLHRPPPPAQAKCDCGTGVDGRERDWNCDRPGLSGTAAQLVTRDTAHRIREHARQRGDTPAGWQRWAEEVLQPSVNWRRQLAAQVRRGAADVTGRVDFTYRRPSRRASAVPDVILPSLRQPLPQVALVIDTSGSMSDTMLGQALAEVTGVLRSLGVARRNLRVIACDAQSYSAQRVRDPRTIRLEGGGGTDMGAGLHAAAQLRPRPDLIVVLTDGLTPWPPAPPPGIRVVVGLMDDRGRTPHWADTVLVGDGASERPGRGGRRARA